MDEQAIRNPIEQSEFFELKIGKAMEILEGFESSYLKVLEQDQFPAEFYLMRRNYEILKQLIDVGSYYRLYM